MINRLPEVLASFSISGRDFSLDECSQRIGRLPTKIWEQSRPDLRSRSDLDSVAWIVRTDWQEVDSLEAALESLLPELWPHQNAIASYVSEQDLSVAVNCSVRIWTVPPLYVLSPQTMRQLAALEAEFGLDIYDFRETDADDTP